MRSAMSRREFLRQSGMLGAAAAVVGAAGSLGADEAAGPAVPKIKLGDLEVSRLILDADPFRGYGHPKYLVCKAMREYYTDERVMQTLDEAARFGVNAIVAPSSGRWPRLFRQYVKQGGKVKIWIAQVEAKPAGMESAIRGCVDQGPKAVFVEGRHTDGLFHRRRFDMLRRWVEHIKSLKVVAGVATYRPYTLPEYQKRRFPIDFCLQGVYRTDEYLEEDREKAFETIKKMPKPVVASKMTLPDSKDPKEAFEFAFNRLAAKDGVCVGVFPKDNPGQIARYSTLTERLSRG